MPRRASWRGGLYSDFIERGPGAGADRAGNAGRRSESKVAGSIFGEFSRNRWAQAFVVWHFVLRVRASVWPGDLHQAEKPAGASRDARDLRIDLRDLQNLPDHAGEIPAVAGSVYRRGDRVVLRRAAALRGSAGDYYSGVQHGWDHGEFWRGLVRDSREHVREFAHGVCGTARQAVSDLSHSAGSRDEHRDDADQRRIADDAFHSAVHPRRLRGAVFYWICDWRISGSGGAAYRGRHFH